MKNNTDTKLFGVEVQVGVPLKDYTTLKMGGPAKYFYKANSEKALSDIYQKAKTLGLPVMVIGGGSDLLISDKGFEGLVIKNEIKGIELSDGRVVAHAGSLLQELVDFSTKKGLAGMEKMTGIPGSIGGAVYGNAGAYGQYISDFLVRVKVFDGGKVKWIEKDSCEFSYRESVFKINKWAILEAEFLLEKGSSPALSKVSREILSLRLEKYRPGLLCPGSFFKNVIVENLGKDQISKIPPEKIHWGKVPAGYLLEEVGAKGARLGNIQIAAHHANLFVNLGEGKPSDFYTLAEKFKAKVNDKFGIKLEPEVQLIGFENV